MHVNGSLRETIEALPLRPGCYIFRDGRGAILYIGKSKCLRARVKSYFRPGQSGKLARLQFEIRALEIVETETETDALLLECEMVKAHRPPYNAQMKADEVYPYLCMDETQDCPGLFVAAEPRDRWRSVGCFTSEADARRTIERLNLVWKTPLCEQTDIGRRTGPCFHGAIGRCSAPCCGGVTERTHRKRLSEAFALFERQDEVAVGRVETAMARLERDMKRLSDAMQFERAQSCAEAIADLRGLLQKSRRFRADWSGEVFVYFRAYREDGFSLFYLRDGVLLDRARFPLDVDGDDLRRFAESIEAGRAPLRDPDCARYLLSARADKLFVTRPAADGVEALRDWLHDRAREFVAPSSSCV